MNRIAAVIAGLSLAFVGTSATIAGTINVPGDYPTIQGAIDASVNGDVINIAAGTYNEFNLNPRGKAITIQGTPNGNGTLATTISAHANEGAAVFLLQLNEGQGTVIKDLVITGGSHINGGGGIYCFGSSPTIIGCTITNNTTPTYGGGIACLNNSSPTVTNCTITDNTTSSILAGGGISCINNSSPTITDCTISGNNGGGIYCEFSNPTITGCMILSNAANEGGGIYCDASDPTMTGCTIKGNTPDTHGGGISCFGDSDATIIDCTISNNTASTDGGGIVVYNGSSPTITNCTISSNTSERGGGIFVYGPTGSSITMTDCTMSDNVPDMISAPGTFIINSRSTIGACCLGGTCITSTESSCTTAGGTYAGDEVICGDAACPTAINGDIDGDGDFDTDDLNGLRNSLGICGHDADMDGDTDIEDLLYIVVGWGTFCTTP